MGWFNSGRRTSTSDSIGRVGRWKHDANGNLVEEASGRGKLTTHVYNALNQKTSTSLPGGRSLVFKSDLMGNLLEATDARGNKTIHTYDALNRLRQTDLPDGGHIAITYDDAGNKLSETDGLGNPTNYVYDDLNRVKEATDALGKKTSYGYDLVGNKTSETDKRGTVTDLTYDKRNRLLSTTKAGIVIQTLTYTPLGKVDSDTDGNGNKTSFEYDKRGLQTARHAPEGANTLEQRDAMGDVVQTTDPEGRVSTAKYDKRRKLIESTNGAKEATRYEYDLDGNKTAMVRPSGTRTDYVFDDRGFMIEVNRPLGNNTSYGYDKNGNLTSIKDGNGHTTSFDYDKLNRRNSVAYPGSTASESMVYDLAGNLKSHADANGITTTFIYDALNRETSRSYSASADGLSQIATDYDANGNRLTVTETYTSGVGGTRVSTYTYDAFDREQSVQDPFGARLSYVYDSNGNRKSLTTQDGKVTAYGYDGLNRLISLTAPGNGGVTRRYDRSGLLTQQDWANGDRTATGYDAAERPLRMTLSQGGTPLSLIEYSYDINGNRTQERINRPAGAQLTGYTYDVLDRLTATERTEGNTTVSTSWTYDPADNRKTESVTTTTSGSGSSTVTRGYTYDERDRLTQITDSAAGTTTLSYDQQGNLKQKVQGGHTSAYTWNARDHLIQYSVDSTVLGRYQTNHEGLRVHKEALDPLNPQGPPQTVRTLWDETNAVQDRDQNGSLLRRYEFIAGHPVMLSVNNGSTDGLQYLHADALGSIIATTDALSGAVKSETLYDAWGNPTAKTGVSSNKFAYTGHEADAESGLYYYEARYYDPTIGRFISQDPAEGKALEPLSYHKYLYAYANPLSYVDPDGRVAFLANSAETLSQFNSWLRDRAASCTDGAECKTAAAFIGVSRGVVGLGELALRGTNVAANTASVMLGQAGLNSQENIDAHSQELKGTLDAAKGAYRTLSTAEGLKGVANKVIITLDKVRSGDSGAISDVAEFASGFVGGAGAAKGAASVASKSAAQVAKQAEKIAAVEAIRGTATAAKVGVEATEASAAKQAGEMLTESAGGPALAGAPSSTVKSVAPVVANSAGLGKNPVFFTSKTTWTAPTKGTGLQYKVFQQEIDWSLEVKGVTNLERAQRGGAPYIMKDGVPQQIQLHHSRQNGQGPLFELSRSTHLETKATEGGKALHPYGKQQHPEYPVDRPLFKKDVPQYWMDRAAGENR